MSPKQFSQLASFVLVIGGFTAIAFTALMLALALVPTQFGWVEHTHKVYISLRAIYIDAEDMETGERGYLLTGKEIYLTPYKRGCADVPGALEAVRVLTKDNPYQQKDLTTLSALVYKKQSESTYYVGLRRGHTLEQVRKQALAERRYHSAEAFETMGQIAALDVSMANREQYLLGLRKQRIMRQIYILRLVGYATGFFLFTFLVVVFVVCRVARQESVKLVAMVQGMRRPVPRVSGIRGSGIDEIIESDTDGK